MRESAREMNLFFVSRLPSGFFFVCFLVQPSAVRNANLAKKLINLFREQKTG